jgi:hypothetical protein
VSETDRGNVAATRGGQARSELLRMRKRAVARFHLRWDRSEGDMAALGFLGALIARSGNNLNVAVERR